MKKGRRDHYRSWIIKIEEVALLQGKPCSLPQFPPGYSPWAPGESSSRARTLQLCGVSATRFLLTESEEGGRRICGKRTGEGLSSEDSRPKLGAWSRWDWGCPLSRAVEVSGDPRARVLLTLTAVWLQTRGCTSLNLLLHPQGEVFPMGPSEHCSVLACGQGSGLC